MFGSVIKRNNVSIEGNLNSSKSIIFGHGFGSNQSAWRLIKESFKEEYKLILYDNVGAGNSDVLAYSPLKYNSLHGYADDLIQIADFLDIRDAVYVGHSVSSMVGLLAASKTPDLVSKMVLIGASPRYLNDIDYLGGFEQDGLDAIYSKMITNYYGWVSGFSRMIVGESNDEILAADFADSLQSLRPDIALAVAKSIFQSDMRNILPDVTAEVLIIQAKNDVAVPPFVGNYLHSRIPDSRLVVIETEGHFPHLSAPAQVTQAIKEFL